MPLLASALLALSAQLPLALRGASRRSARHALGLLQRQRGRPLADSELLAPSLILAPHPDDEVLGCGGLIATMQNLGAQPIIVFLTDGSGSHEGLVKKDVLRQQRQREALAAAAVLGVPSENVHFLDYPDGDLESQQKDAEKRVLSLVKKYQTRQLFIPIQRQEHPDHEVTGAIGYAARKALASQISLTLFEYPIWFMRHWPWVACAGTEDEAQDIMRKSVSARLGAAYLWLFDTYLDIHPLLAQKRLALAAHVSQMEHKDGDPRWHTLNEICSGDFVDAFFTGYEVFRRVPSS